MTPERELSSPVDLCGVEGRLNPEAVGWSRRPLHRCNLSSGRGRKKRWDYWCITAPGHLLSVTVADLDYLGMLSVLFLDLETGQRVAKAAAVPLGVGFELPEQVAGHDIRISALGLEVEIREEPRSTRLVVRSRKLSARIEIAKPPDHESVNVVVPWSDRRFQYTSKHNTRPASGSVTARGRRYTFDPDQPAFGTLDFGRGLFPYRTVWNWASASGIEDGRTIGLQFGGQWTDGTGSTENGVCLDGRVHKISEAVQFEYDSRAFTQPWTLRSERVELRFEPWRMERLLVPLGIASANLHLCFGHFSGRVRLDGETWLGCKRVLGWAEEMRARW